MLKQLLIALMLFSSLSLSAQSQLGPRQLKASMEKAPWKKKALTGAENISADLNPNLPLLPRTDVELTVGTTTYDLQSNSGTPRRLHNHPDGTKYATWTIGYTSTAYPDRGTGFNTYDPGAGTWGSIPTARIEDKRTGWPNIGVLGDDTPVVIAHQTDENKMYMSKWVNNAWQFANVPTNVAAGVIWPRMAIGGTDKMTIHLIGLTYPVANGGAAYAGVDGHVLYYRSTDGGQNWDMIDVILPDIDSNFYARMDADSYFIDASGNTVAIGLFADLGDVKLSKSDDNGATWTTYTLHDFPIDKYAIDQGYTAADIPLDLNAPDSLAIQSSDNTGAVLVDQNGMVHAWFGEMYYIDDDLTDNNFSYYPGWMGMRYWNETLGENTTNLIIPGIVDANGNDTLDIASISNIALYYSSLTSHPSVGMDEDGNIFMAYSGLTENYINPNAMPNAQHNRHVYLTVSTDGGETWSEPLDAINENWVIEPDLLAFIETMFPSVARRVDNQMHLIFQEDFEPGLSARGDMDTPAENTINYLAVDKSDLGFTSGTENVPAQELSFEISPNPASGLVRISYELSQPGQASIRVYDMVGQQVKTLESNDLQSAGSHHALLSTEGLATGIYLVRLQAGEKFATQKLVVR